MSFWRRTSKLKWLSTWVGILALFMLGILNFQGTVLCFESDGRVAVESSTNGLCSDSLQTIQKHQMLSTPAKAALNAAHCRHCVDVSFNVVGNAHPNQVLRLSQGEIDAPLLAPMLFGRVGYLATATQQQLPQPPPLRPAVHHFLSTVVLLI